MVGGGRESKEAWWESVHDDLVLGTAGAGTPENRAFGLGYSVAVSQAGAL